MEHNTKLDSVCRVLNICSIKICKEVQFIFLKNPYLFRSFPVPVVRNTLDFHPSTFHTSILKISPFPYPYPYHQFEKIPYPYLKVFKINPSYVLIPFRTLVRVRKIDGFRPRTPEDAKLDLTSLYKELPCIFFSDLLDKNTREFPLNLIRVNF